MTKWHNYRSLHNNVGISKVIFRNTDYIGRFFRLGWVSLIWRKKQKKSPVMIPFRLWTLSGESRGGKCFLSASANPCHKMLYCVLGMALCGIEYIHIHIYLYIYIRTYISMIIYMCSTCMDFSKPGCIDSTILIHSKPIFYPLCG